MDAPGEIANPSANCLVRPEHAAGEEHRIRETQFLRVVIRFGAQQGIAGMFQLLIAAQPRFQHPINAGTKPLKILFETPRLDRFNLLPLDGREVEPLEGLIQLT